MINNMLNLKDFKIIDMKESEDDYRFLVIPSSLALGNVEKCIWQNKST